MRRIVYCRSAQTLTGIRENVRRMHAIGSPVHTRLVGLHHRGRHQGVAGAPFAQTNSYATLTVFDFSNT